MATNPLAPQDFAARDIVPLTRTKLRPPRPPARLVAGERHRTALHTVLAHSVCLVRAPSGYGKSTLCAAWHALLAERGCATAWVSFEREDDEAALAIGYMLEAVGAALRGRSGLEGLAAGLLANDGVIIPRLLATRLVNIVDAADEPVVLFLDDLDRLTDPGTLQFLNYLLLHCPPNLHLVLACQARLALPLPHLENHGQLARIGVAELRLHDPEARDLLAAAGAPLADDEVRRLNEAMGGWVTGLRIGAAALRNNRDALFDIGLSAHGARWLTDYLDENIFQHLTATARSFLTRCAVVATMTAELCSELSGLPDAGVMLAWLADQNLFVQRLDEAGDWFTIHAVFREFLLDRLARAEPADAAARLHRVASRWFAAHGQQAAAIGHALDAGDIAAAAALIETVAMPMVERSDILTLLGWLARLPEAAVRDRIPLRLAEAWALTLSLRPQTRARLDDLARCPRTPDLDGELAGIETIFLAVYEDRLDAALEHGRDYLRRGDTDGFASRAVRNATAFCELARGDHAEVHALVRPAQLNAQRNEQVFTTAYRYSVVGLSYRAQGELGEAERTFAAGFALALRRGGPGSASAALLAPFLARCRYERDDLDGAASLLVGRLPVIDEACFSEALINAYSLAVRLAAARGHVGDAAALIEHAELLGHERAWVRLLAQCMVERVRLGLPQTIDADRLLLPADEVAAIATPLSLDARTFAILAEYRAETALAAGDWGRLDEICARLKQLAAAAANREWLLKAHAYTLLPRLVAGIAMLPEPCVALSMAAVASGYRRLFTDIFETPVRRPHLLPANLPLELTTLVRLPPPSPTAASAAPPTVFELLTSREIDVLAGVGAGASNKDIARQLHLTPETVKWHLKNVMRKLDADSRSAAVRKAAGLGLALAD